MIHVETPDAVSASFVRAYLRVFNAAGTNVGGGIYSSEASSLFAVRSPGRGGYWLASKPFQVTDVATQADIQIEIYWPKAQGGSFTVKIDRPILTVIPEPRPAWNLP